MFYFLKYCHCEITTIYCKKHYSRHKKINYSKKHYSFASKAVILHLGNFVVTFRRYGKSYI